ncbi:SPOR domain-containing protein [Candidatus Berkiella aquae]|uniref:Cell division protein FtsN n=1 Tax=Candidatus Berkiella aquae TaxID=295108 RepID=A0A0Q9YN74_9GAMM|nr:SPOR domain-containing protein [Candidatus Berkiella aquae]MCS5712637.1 SPOR domain-containing protein [Candidatus Berkiella aquae]
MTKDYAKKRRLHAPVKSRGHTASSTLIMPTWAWMITGLTLGLTLAAILYWKLNAKHALPQTATIAIEETSSKGTQKQRVSAQSQEEKSHRFDFYTVLPSMTMDTPDSTTSTVDLAMKAEPSLPLSKPQPQETQPQTTALTTPQASPAPSAETESKFIVQVGAFRTLQQAEELKAQLTLSGMQASIQTFERSPSDTWHRVYVGPFTNKSEAHVLQQRLQQTQALNGLVLKMRV